MRDCKVEINNGYGKIYSMAEVGERHANKVLIGILSVLILAIIGLGISVVILILRRDSFSSRTASEVCRVIEEDFMSISDDSLGELANEFELASKDENKLNEDFEICYIILRDLYQRVGNQNKVQYYEGFLDELLPKDDRSFEELMGGE